MSSSDIAARFTDFSGRTVLVTGGGRGIGAGIARAFAEAGAHVVIGYRSSDQGATELASEIGGRAVRADLALPGGADALLDATPDVDVLVNNAGIYPLKPLLEMTDEDWHETLEVNSTSVFRLSRRAAQRMAPTTPPGPAKPGTFMKSIINISSIEARAPGFMHAHYSAAKAAVEMFTRAAALELGPRGLRVNAVAPGLINYPDLSSLWPEGVERWNAKCPLGRLGERGDVADACVFLASPAASFITGATLVVDGGVLSTPAF